MSNKKDKFRFSITVPFSVLKIIDDVVDFRKSDGESSVSRNTVCLDFLKLAARIYKKQLENDSTKTLNESNLDEQLKFIAKEVLKTKLKVDAFFEIYSIVQCIDSDLVQRILSETRLSDDERSLLESLFNVE
ncbi:hypothetical protein [Pasteurella multocida]|uniref:hypothetical protein n=1 Tax=Pasteurella multocida TaxID=747 RepID=UPI00147DE260|nr:hypothetical protein [Pasteurella multocida]NNH97772.1 hypothetical protein [Pasteurella multocida]NNI42885.1 hypothetical protein [Pasteurella multocida]